MVDGELIILEKTNVKLLQHIKHNYGSIAAAAYKIGIDRATLSKIVHGRMEIPKHRKILIAKRLEIDSREIFQD